jgi:thioredoxin-like negative regulator of GroEL
MRRLTSSKLLANSQMAFKNGKVIGQFIGAQQEGGVKKFLEEIKTK